MKLHLNGLIKNDYELIDLYRMFRKSFKYYLYVLNKLFLFNGHNLNTG